MISGPQMVEGSLILLSSQLPRRVRHPPPLIHQTRPQQSLHKCPLSVVAEEVGSEGGEGAVVQIVETAEIQIPTIITKTDNQIIQAPTKIKSQEVKSLTREVLEPVQTFQTMHVPGTGRKAGLRLTVVTLLSVLGSTSLLHAKRTPPTEKLACLELKI